MDKHEFNIKVDQIKKMMGKGDLETAMKIADTIDWRRVRNANLLSMISSVYEKNEEYQEAKDILLIAFERAPVGKRLLYKLTQLAVKQGNVQEAESYYREFCDLAGDDSRQDILRYLILKAKGAPLEQLIHTLESYTSAELDEKWLYELAELYHQAGMEDECVRTCDKIMLMFGLGQYVDKAMELKLQYAPLTKYQMDLVENRDKYEEKLKQVEQNGGDLAAGAPSAGGYGMSGQPEAVPAQGYGAYAQPVGESAPGYGSYAQPAEGAAPGYGSYAQSAEGAAPGYGSYAQPAEGAAPGYGAYAQSAEGAAPGYGTYGQPAGGPAPGYGTYAQPEAVPAQGYGAYGQPGAAAPDHGAYAQPEAASAQSYGPYAQPEGATPGYGAYAKPKAAPAAVPAAYRQPEGSGLESEETTPVRVEPRPIPVAPPVPEIYPSTEPETAMPQVNEDVMSGISASFGAGAYERTDTGVTAEEDLVASVREAEVEASLAEEMSRMSMNGYAEEPIRQRTRVLKDVKDLKETEALAGKTKVYGDIRHIQEVKAIREQARESAAQEMEVRETAVREPAVREPAIRESAEKETSGQSERVRTTLQATYPHMMVETRSPEIGLKIAVETLKKAHQLLGFKHPVVKISGDKLDQKGVAASAAKLVGKDLIIEEAGDLSDERLRELEQLLVEDTSQMLVMLVDTPRQMNAICKAVPSLTSRFKVVTSMDEAEFYLYEMTGQKRGRESRETIIRMRSVEAAEKAAPVPDPRRGTSPSADSGNAVRYVRPADQPQPSQPRPHAQPTKPQPSRPRAVEPVYNDTDAVGTAGKTRRTDRPSAQRDQGHEGSYTETKVIGKAPRGEVRRPMVFQGSDEEEDDQTVMGIDEFAQCCCEYADQIDCSITGKSMLALYERIEIMEADGIALTKTAAEDLIEEAADKAEKPSFGKRLTGLFSSKYDKNGSLILKEEHFI